ncbi:hypothetical protein CPB83DRAFT_920146 [Crepidotus variabilis]|uniref:RRM domain-containing protein n=1 Tax=Crepidotus variabilis TaxID=179855 RepID=A0A9P6JS72_9AGAR|nr:hypothetical protein CPB83DRAFT_920146 [Crepidotus variabilis]
MVSFSEWPILKLLLIVPDVAQYSDAAPATVDPYSDAYNAPPAAAPAEREPTTTRGRSRSRSPTRPTANGGESNGEPRRYERSPSYRNRRSPPPRRSAQGSAPTPSNVLGVFGLSIRTQERDLEDEFSRFGHVDKVTIVYDQRVVDKSKQSDRSRGFGFIKMSTTEEATKCIQELNGVELNGRRIRVDYSVTERPHAPTPGEYMGHRRSGRREFDRRRDDRDDRDRYRDRDSRRDRSRDRDHYGRDRDWRDRRSPPPKRGHSPDHRRRRSHSRSPPPRERSPHRSTNGRDFEAPAGNSSQDNGRW